LSAQAIHNPKILTSRIGAELNRIVTLGVDMLGKLQNSEAGFHIKMIGQQQCWQTSHARLVKNAVNLNNL
jgi:hypothetical protein